LAIFLVYWIYTALAWSKIAKKLKYKKDWLAWIPFARTGMIFQLGGFHWAWAFLWLVPVLGWAAVYVLGIICNWRIFEKRKYNGWFALILVLAVLGEGIGSLAGVAYLIILGFVAWKERKKKPF
jgi:hypothetical protein